jgi:hypothetical protein
MKVENQLGAPPDVSCIQKFDSRELNEVNDRLMHHGWVLLGILHTRDIADGGSFTDSETYIIGMKRAGGR